MSNRPSIGDMTEFGEVVALGMRDGERWFIAIDADNSFALIPLSDTPQPQ